jgi:hypothetical protein
LLFPNLSSQPLFGVSAWPGVILFLSFSLGDTAGKFSSGYRYLYNKYSIIYLFILRCFFIWSIAAIIHYPDSIVHSYGFIYINQFLFAFSNGIVTSINLILFRCLLCFGFLNS